MKTIALIMNHAMSFNSHNTHDTLQSTAHSFNLPSLMCTCNTGITCSRHKCTPHCSLTMDLNKAPMGPFQIHDPLSHKMDAQIFYGCIWTHTTQAHPSQHRSVRVTARFQPVWKEREVTKEWSTKGDMKIRT